MANQEIFTKTAVSSWKLVIGRIDEGLAALSDADFQLQIAPGKNRVFYLVGHLAAVHDRLFPMLGLGERLHPELDKNFLENPDRKFADELSAADLRKVWAEVNGKLTTAFEALRAEDWLKRHTSVSEEDFAKDPLRQPSGGFVEPDESCVVSRGAECGW